MEAVETRLRSIQFAKIFQAYVEASDEVQEVIREMTAICNDPEATESELEAAIDTLIEALFPNNHNGSLGIEIGDLRDHQHGIEATEAIKELDRERSTFADRLAGVMKQRNLTQEALAEKVGIGQPAISMMLARSCRPQRKTVAKIAEALEISPEALWPRY